MDHDDDEMIVKDSNGTRLREGDSVQPIKDLKVKGSSTIIKRGTLIRNIHLTNDEKLIGSNSAPAKGLLLETQYLKKV